MIKILSLYKTQTMRALEFKSKIKDNQIQVPDGIQSQLVTNQEIRVIVLLDDPETNDDLIFRQSAKKRFFKGYADSDSIFDDY